ncbi:hypothetical protein OE88DRAFT_1619304 [Heliocybe sulcata]|uniref:FAM86 N-terminal domain-containing protein n=1 Tax=Heliocybe sulcata TaxID=5364 RepID=A0A5C3NH97_9AGAM|nr:hypothetical protein OE88DRAFT_1619304 [Heliocybe sulcata]
MAKISRDVFDLLRGYGALLPARFLAFPGRISWSKLHDILLNNVLSDEHFRLYPPSTEYQRAFWKAAIDHLEAHIPDGDDDCEIDARIYDHYMALLPRVYNGGTCRSSATAGIPAPSYTTQFWSTDPSYLSQDEVGLASLSKLTLLESRAFIERGTTGLRTWPASLALAEYLVLHPDIVANRRVLELGSGAGFLGIVIGSIQVLHGSRRASLHLTDVHEEVLSRCEKNLNLLCNASSQHRDVHYHALDWADARDSNRRSCVLDLFKDTSAEVILGADLVFDPDLIPALVETIALGLLEGDSSSTTTSTAILALTVRNRDTFGIFERLASELR